MEINTSLLPDPTKNKFKKYDAAALAKAPGMDKESGILKSGESTDAADTAVNKAFAEKMGIALA